MLSVVTKWYNEAGSPFRVEYCVIAPFLRREFLEELSNLCFSSASTRRGYHTLVGSLSFRMFCGVSDLETPSNSVII